MEDHMLLPGHRFCPLEDELLLYYLKPKLDLYGDQEPWKIWERFEARRANDLRKNKDLYFFTQKKKVSAKASRISQKVGSGTWKGQAAAKDVYLLDENQKPTTTLLGFKKTYTYQNKRSVHHGRWIMYEFELHKSQLLPNKMNDYVLCLLRKNDQLPERKRKRQQEEEMLEEDYVEGGDGDNDLNCDPALLLEEPHEKRQCLLPCSDNNVAAPSLEWAELEQWFNQQFLQPLEAGATPLEDEPAVSLQVYEDLGVLQPHDENLEQQMGDEVGVMAQGELVDVYGGNLSDVIVGEDWAKSFMEDLMNDEQLNTMED
ncbi:NAC domain-containing protein 83-like [Rosa rugosa]|uniref:NAC domain-containing protein 83-like n=1 Tax=Rosa rugosa TaxID=74645 RepID=UPI002B416817|nr:NAC domain-containing protein 83-like [Rosa rugosa]